MNPDGVVAYHSRCEAFYLKGDLVCAFADANEAIRLGDLSAVEFGVRSLGDLAKLDFDHAVADASEAIRLAPQKAFGYTDRSAAYLGKLNFPQAIADATRD